MTYYTIEIQAPGGIIPVEYSPDEYANPKAEAEAAYHTILSVAAKSTVPRHGCMLVNSEGDVEKREFYTHVGGEGNG